MPHRRAGVTLWAPSPLPWPSLVRGAPAAIAANPVVIASSPTGPYTLPAGPRRGSATDVVGNHVHPGADLYAALPPSG